MDDRDTLLDRSPESAVRILGLQLLDEATAAAGLVRSDSEIAALHDFRVALRRLRTLFKAYRALLSDSVPKKQVRALRDLAGSTGDARDAEVQLEWLAAQREKLEPGARVAWSWMTDKLEARRQAAYSTVRRETLPRFGDLEPDLRRGLSRYEATVIPDAARPTFALAVAGRIRSTVVELPAAIHAVRKATDMEEAHQARIQVKRLRYLLEPLRNTSLEQPVGHLIRSVKALQDVLGALHDGHVLAGEIATALVDTATARARTLHAALYSTDPAPPPEPDLLSGILSIDQLVRDGVAARFEDLRSDWHAERFESLSAEVADLAAALDRHGCPGSGIEREPGMERGFLLGGEARGAVGVAALDEARELLEGAQEDLELEDRGTAREKSARAIELLLKSRIELLLTEQNGARDGALAVLLGELGTLAHDAGDLGTAERARTSVVEISERLLPEDHPDLLDARLDLATTLFVKGDLQGARLLQERVVQAREQTLATDHLDLLRARRDLANAMRRMGQVKEARSVLDDVVAAFEMALPGDHPDLLRALLSLGTTMAMMGDLLGARGLFERVLEVRERTLPEDHCDLLAARLNLAATMHSMGDLPGARVLQERVLECYERTLPEDHPDLLRARANIANTMRAMGDLPGAQAILDRVLGVYERTLSEDHPDLLLVRGHLASTIRAMGGLQERVLDARERTLPEGRCATTGA